MRNTREPPCRASGGHEARNWWVAAGAGRGSRGVCPVRGLALRVFSQSKVERRTAPQPRPQEQCMCAAYLQAHRTSRLHNPLHLTPDRSPTRTRPPPIAPLPSAPHASPSTPAPCNRAPFLRTCPLLIPVRITTPPDHLLSHCYLSIAPHASPGTPAPACCCRPCAPPLSSPTPHRWGWTQHTWWRRRRPGAPGSSRRTRWGAGGCASHVENAYCMTNRCSVACCALVCARGLQVCDWHVHVMGPATACSCRTQRRPPGAVGCK